MFIKWEMTKCFHMQAREGVIGRVVPGPSAAPSTGGPGKPPRPHLGCGVCRDGSSQGGWKGTVGLSQAERAPTAELTQTGVCCRCGGRAGPHRGCSRHLQGHSRSRHRRTLAGYGRT